MEEIESIITSWDYEGEQPVELLQSPMIAKETTVIVTDDKEGPLFRALSQKKKPEKQKWRRIGQLLTNRSIADLSIPELQVALISFGESTSGTRDELIKRLRSCMKTHLGSENVNEND